MKTFNGIEIVAPKPPIPEVNQVWYSNKYDVLYKIIKKVGKYQFEAESECGDKAWIGLSWFNNQNYIFIGTLKQ